MLDESRCVSGPAVADDESAADAHALVPHPISAPNRDRAPGDIDAIANVVLVAPASSTAPVLVRVGWLATGLPELGT